MGAGHALGIVRIDRRRGTTWKAGNHRGRAALQRVAGIGLGRKLTSSQSGYTHPQPAACASPASLSFGDVNSGSTSVEVAPLTVGPDLIVSATPGSFTNEVMRVIDGRRLSEIRRVTGSMTGWTVGCP